jgi:16S rRNA (uracil1498-N3)-methyltransferase
MNLILFEKPFETIELSADDHRVQHILTVLKIQEGGVFFVGFINSKRALVKLVKIKKNGTCVLSIEAMEEAPKLLPIHLCVAMPRPHTAKRILFEAASLGVSSIYFFRSEKGEPSYCKSSLWNKKNYQERLKMGLEQSFATHLPKIFVLDKLGEILALIGAVNGIALDNYDADESLGCKLSSSYEACYLAFGPERGFSENERLVFKENQWKLAHLGSRVLRLETAVVASITIAAEKMGCWNEPTTSTLVGNNN